MRKDVQNQVLDRAYGALGDLGYQVRLPRDSVTELYFDNLESMGQTFADPYAREVVGPDAVDFSDQPAALSLLVERWPTPRAMHEVNVITDVATVLPSADSTALQGIPYSPEAPPPAAPATPDRRRLSVTATAHPVAVEQLVDGALDAGPGA